LRRKTFDVPFKFISAVASATTAYDTISVLLTFFSYFYFYELRQIIRASRKFALAHKIRNEKNLQHQRWYHTLLLFYS
jgi:hypothetical protein